MENFTLYTPTKVVFGKDREQELGTLLQEEKCRKVLIHYGLNSIIRSGLLAKVENILEREGFDYVKLGGVVPNPRLSLVHEGIELCKKEGVDFILAVGGGSAIDSAKAIAYGTANEGDVWDFYSGKRTPKACLPLGVILTIAATGSETGKSSVITKDDGMIKIGYNNNLSRPKFAIMNPELTYTLPPYQTASGCVDIMMHTMERYFNQSDNMELTDAFAEALIRTVMKHAKILMQNPHHYESRAEVMWAGSLSHNDLMGCGTDGGDWACHKLEHELGGLYDVAHGAGLAAIWSTWARYVYENRVERFEQFAVNVMGMAGDSPKDTALKGISAMEDYFRSINMPVSITELVGHTPSNADIETMAEKCRIVSNNAAGVIKKLNKDDFIEIYKLAR